MPALATPSWSGLARSVVRATIATAVALTTMSATITCVMSFVSLAVLLSLLTT